MRQVLPGAIIQEELPAPAAPLGRKGRARLGKKKAMYRGNSMRKPTPLSIVPSCATLEMSLRALLLFPQPQAGKPDPPANGAPCPLLISFPAKPEPLGFPRSITSSGGCCQWCVSARASWSQQDQPSPGGHGREEPSPPTAAGTLQCLPALPSCLPPLSKKNISAFSSFQAAAPPRIFSAGTAAASSRTQQRCSPCLGRIPRCPRPQPHH